MASGSRSSSQGEEEPPHGAKGTSTEPFDSGAFTLEVLAHTDKGDGEGAVVSLAGRGLEVEQRTLCSGLYLEQHAVVDGGKEREKTRNKGKGRRARVAR
ncbi:hypothetical protein ZWY2020_034101 [Hordeum vulgare]|nr:hypothetical protein ZWY2020_034101 [Hordeum vulgare]